MDFVAIILGLVTFVAFYALVEGLDRV